MAIQFNFVSSMLILVLLSISSVKVQGGGWGGVVDVVAKFGAKAGDQQIEPLLDAWKEACASTSPSKIVIPKGIYFLRSATLDGPCKVPIQLQIEGTVKAPTDPGAFREPKWIAFNRIENFKLSGGGVFDSQGTTTYKREGCKGHDYCGSLPIIKTGDDCVSIADGSKNLVINGVTCGPRHGISIGSLNCAEPGTCLNIHFEDIIVTNVNSPIIIDQKYFPWNKRKINVCTYLSKSNICFKNIHDTSARPEVVKIICSATLPCENVELADVEITHSGSTGPAVSQCLNVKPKVRGKQNPAACSAPIPAKPTPTA
ncbi:hypothetical protein ES332_A02G134600v1 [Gossypium tomentosum]|uniref:Pectate lyase superfamily protein domain-containing protein n=1 Tax=Gossypium tomentosum TaxID=34277 RepID=A0A5D2RGY8_GOSTO|nr:hypothetical protein ES332_A02G134600v1 [Gossypium tomentosum]